MGTRNLHIYFPSTFLFESRILKETRTISEHGYFDKIYIAAYFEDGQETRQAIDNIREVNRFKSRLIRKSNFLPFKILRFISINLRSLFYYRKKSIHTVNAHSINVLPIAVLMKKVYKAKLIYDTHELETEKNGLGGWKQKALKILERVLIGYCDKVITVCEPISDWYKETYNLNNVSTVRNMPHAEPPFSEKPNFLKSEFGISDDTVLFIYQGLISFGRGIEKILDVFSSDQVEHHIVLMGYGDHEEMVVEYSQRYSNIHFKQAVPPDQITRYTASADVGIILLDNTCLSYFLSLPNKYFEYINCELPIFCWDWPCMGPEIIKSGNGWAIDYPSDNETLINRISSLNLEMVSGKKDNCLTAKSQVGWHIDESTLIKVYTD